MIVKYDSDARNELDDIIDYYNNQKSGLGTEFLQAIELAVDTIVHAPERWPLFRHPYRRYLLDRFPYSIHYEVELDMIVIFAIAHTSRKPGYWKTRLEH